MLVDKRWFRVIPFVVIPHTVFTFVAKPVFLHVFLGAFAKCDKRLLASSCPSVRMEHLGSHWTDFDET